MALTQEQKNTISIISQSPENVLLNFKERPYYLKSFKNKFFKDGTGLVEKTLFNYFLTGENIFIELFSFIVKNSSITPFDKRNTQLSALESIQILKDWFENFSFKMFNVLSINNPENYNHIISINIVDLYENNFKDKSLSLITKYNDSKLQFSDLLKSILKNQDVEFLELVLKNYTTFDQIKAINLSENNGVFKNILYICLEKKLENLSKILIEKFPLLILNENETITLKTKKEYPILGAITNENPTTMELINLMDNKLLVKNFNYTNSNGKKILNCLLNKNYSNTLKEKTLFALNSNIENYQKINILKSVFESSVSYVEKFDILIKGLDENITETYSHIAIFNSFIFSIQQYPDIENKLFNQFITEFKKRNLISQDQIFNNCYFKNIKYFNLIYNSDEFKNYNPLDFIDSFIREKNSLKIENQEDSDYIWSKISQLNFKKLKSKQKYTNALHIMLVNNYDCYVNYFKEENLKNLLLPSFNPHSYSKNKNSKEFYEILENLIDFGLSFETNPYKITKIMSFNPPEKLLTKIINKSKSSIKFLSNEVDFWNYVNSEEIFNYCIEKNANIELQDHCYSLVYQGSLSSLELYLKNEGSVKFSNDKGNILHNLFQNSNRLKHEEALSLIFYHPELATKANKNNKYPVSYLMKDFNKLCQNYKLKTSNNIKNDIDNYYKVIKAMFECGLCSKNKKAFNHIEGQFLKYLEISEIFPDLISILRFNKLNQKLDVKNNDVKFKKIKI